MSDERKRLTKRVVDAAKPLAKAYILWDSDLAGFGLRVSPSGAKAYIASYRVGVGRGAKQRRVSIGRSSAMTCEAARREATVYIAAARTGDDRREEVHFDAASAAKDLTVKEAIELWRAEAAPRNRRNGKKRRQKNIDNDVNRLNAHVVPLIGKRLVSSLTAQDIAKLRDDITEGKTACVVKTKKHGVRRVTGGAGTATRTIRTFKSVLSYCVDRQLVPANVAIGVKLAPDGQSERYLTVPEAAAIGKRITIWESQDRRMKGIRIIKLLALTGARTGEMEELEWTEIDFDQSFLRFGDSKSGKSVRPLSPEALEVLRTAPRLHPKWVFPNKYRTGPYCGTQGVWRDLRKEAGLNDVRKHDLRHSFASFGLSEGLSLPIIGTLLGHLRPETTQRYAHLADAQARQAAVSVGGAVGAALRL
ncbi:MAG TPA: site-specific integrase [Amphiplicatus sp.]|nr:site-specific integrase [Amphiplicatus sp.]MCB9956171.1 site-specific integrase [Caulobacterales bacterium]HOP18468.1 site-specific integrase [Amphiplicatus sp.]